MQHLSLSLPTPEENLALDEALLDRAEEETESADPREILRLWEPQDFMVIVGRSSDVDREVHVAHCREEGVPILRRSSGGTSIVAGPGCLMYALVLSYERLPALRAIDVAHAWVLKRIAAALEPLAPHISCRGTSDLALGELKCSGNSMRVKCNHMLYHGTLLYDFPLHQIGDYLKHPPREPGYREGRDHEKFLTNLPTDAGLLSAAMLDAWDAHEPMKDWPRKRVQALVQAKYAREEWNRRS